MCICDYNKNRIVTCEKCGFRFGLGYKQKSGPGSPKIYSSPFSKIFESSSAWTILTISFISLFEIIKVVVPDPNVFLCIPAYVAVLPQWILKELKHF